MIARNKQLSIASIQKAIAIVAVCLGFACTRYSIEQKALVFVLAIVAGIASYCTSSRWIAAASGVALAYPILPILGIVGTWLAACFELGHVPQPSLDDPKSIGRISSLMHGLSWLELSLCGEMVLAWLVLGIANVVVRFKEPSKNMHQSILVFLVAPIFSWSALFLFAKSDPGWIVTWFFD